MVEAAVSKERAATRGIVENALKEQRNRFLTETAYASEDVEKLKALMVAVDEVRGRICKLNNTQVDSRKAYANSRRCLESLCPHLLSP